MSNNKESKDLPPAITYSTNNRDGVPLVNQPRPPRNLQDLLRYSTEATNALGGGVSAAAVVSLDEESKQFLEGALTTVTIDIVEQLLSCINIVKNAGTIPEDGDLSEYEEALDNIFDFVDNLDVANDFHKIGGFCVLQPCLESSHSSLRWRGAELIAELCQNNPYCQSKMIETGIMPHLLKMVDTDVNEIVQIKALYAVSCLVRENEEGLKEFIKSDGFSVLLRALQSDVEKLNIKSAFLVSSLCHWKPEIKDELVSMGYVEQLISQLAARGEIFDEEHPPCLEHFLNAILDIIEDKQQAQKIARRPELQFKNLLDGIVKNSEDNDQYNEENQHAKNLIRIVFGECENDQEER